MKNSDEYQTIVEPGEAQLKVKGSRFIGLALPVQTVEQVQEQLARINKKYYNASHNCFAYQIGLGQPAKMRYSDAGEPAGTAGLPIYQVIEGRDLTNVLVVITRYFGGIKLGKGGLVRAYRDTTICALDNTQIVTKIIWQHLAFSIAYTKTGEVMHLLQSVNARIRNSDYGTDVKLFISVRNSQAAQLKAKLIEITHNKIRFDE